MENENILYNDDIIKVWSEECKSRIINMLDQEINEIPDTIRNEHLWELGYDGEDPNPHTQNIMNLEEYRKRLEFFHDMIEHISI